MDDEDLPEAHPAFAAHFTDPIYDDADEDAEGELTPFGSDEGFDLLHEWDERRDELHPGFTVAELIDESGFADVVESLDVREGPGVPTPGGQVDAAVVVVSAAFTLLRLAGHVDEAGRRRALHALDVLIDHYDAPPELTRQRQDLESWPG